MNQDKVKCPASLHASTFNWNPARLHQNSKNATNKTKCIIPIFRCGRISVTDLFSHYLMSLLIGSRHVKNETPPNWSPNFLQFPILSSIYLSFYLSMCFKTTAWTCLTMSTTNSVIPISPLSSSSYLVGQTRGRFKELQVVLFSLPVQL